MSDGEYGPNAPWISYEGGATFVRVCENCSRFVKSDDEVTWTNLFGLKDCPNATCKKCGRTKMIFVGFY
jgi:hypothetical protein